MSNPTTASKPSDDELKKRLSPLEYEVTQCSATERPFTGKYYKHKEPGVYTCVVCHEKLFPSTSKYESGSGWPSFYATMDNGKVAEETDRSQGMERTEIKCANCGAHLGHVFDDGPDPTGLRYCVNSASLGFEKQA